MPPALWPPLDDIRHALTSAAREPDASALPVAADVPINSASPPLPPLLADLAARRERVRALAPATSLWEPGWIVATSAANGQRVAVLLDRPSSGAPFWHGWLAVPETAWAGVFDVLLEREDEPFDPAAGVIQAWNPVVIPAPAHAPPVLLLGRLSAHRLAAIRAVDEQRQAHAQMVIPAEPGVIALRSVFGQFTVLTGTPLGADDPRADYQTLYRDLAAALIAQTQQSAASPKPQPTKDATPGRWWAGVKGWFAADWAIRPAFVALCAALLLRGLWPNPVALDDDVRFRSAPMAPTGEVISVRWQDGITAEAALTALQSVGGQVVAHDASGQAWQIRVPDAEAARQTLQASPWVKEVRLP